MSLGRLISHVTVWSCDSICNMAVDDVCFCNQRFGIVNRIEQYKQIFKEPKRKTEFTLVRLIKNVDLPGIPVMVN